MSPRCLSRRLIRSLAPVALLALGACRSSPRNFENVNDQLRQQNLQLQQQVRDLEEKLRLASANAQTLQQRLAQTQPALPDLSLWPIPVELRLDRYSAVLDSDRDGSPDLIRLYVKSRDARGRFAPLIGRLQVQAVEIPPQGQPRLCAERALEPQALDPLYRSTWMGTHYTIEIPFADLQPPPSGDLTVKLTFTDALTGSTLTYQQSLPLPPP